MYRLLKTGAAACAAMLCLMQPVSADWWQPSQAEMGALPAYCAAKFNEGKDPEAASLWRSSMGGDFIHLHHYCAGLNFLNRARGVLASGNNGILESAVREFDYVLNNCSPGFYLRPEIWTNRGIALSMMKRDGEAVSDLLKAIELDPKQPRAYTVLADLYEKLRNRSKALQTVTDGLRHNPGTKSLQHRYTELGGRLPYPAPIEAAPAAANPAETAAATPPGGTSSAAESIAPAKIGSPTNPYCRFCPD